MHPIPVLHGMTIGEYSQMINGEHWLKNGISCKLTIIPCSYYNRKNAIQPAYKTITKLTKRQID
jgi:uncharacterized protein YbbC (DUF1343 family)